MDILSHGLWAGAGAKVLNKKFSGRFSVVKAFFWGAFPDIFAFAVPLTLIFFNLLTGQAHFSDFPRPEQNVPFPSGHFPLFSLASALYNFSHSAVIFLLVFLAMRFIRHRFSWEMSGWLLHILSDIPTHKLTFFPTPIFWPFFGWKFAAGFLWTSPGFLVINYALLIVVYLLLRKQKFSE